MATDPVQALRSAGLRLFPQQKRQSLKWAALGLLSHQQLQTLKRALGRQRPWDVGQRLRPPPCPYGMEVAPPDFVGIGTQKAGTSWWDNLLHHHPRVYRPPDVHKERHFFGRFVDRDLGVDDIEEYHRWFPRPPGHLAGEWTPDYMHHFWIPRLLKLAAPDTKLLVLLRDPVERFVSGLNFGAARSVMSPATADQAYLRGNYFEHLGWLRTHFDPSRVLVQQYEKCCRDPAAELARTAEFLGLAPFASDLPFQAMVNARPVEKVALDAAKRQDLVAIYRPGVEKLLDRYPDFDVTLWPNFAFLAR